MAIAVIVGATGLTGTFLTRKLLEDPDIEQVISVSRKSVELRNAKLTEVLIPNLDLLNNVAAKLKGDFYYSCLGTTIKAAGSKEQFRKVDHDAIVEFGRIAKNHNAKSFSLVSAMGANKDSFVFYNKVKGETEQALRELGLSSLNIFRPALLVGPRKEFRLAEKIFVNVFNPVTSVLPVSLRKRIVTKAVWLAQRMLEVSKSKNAGLNIFEPAQI